ncbi:hypothetical protein KR059_008927 [Drosophila kikkawai]|nr:hypothetical protein KR059_008927 [Drosophila kikkawai]
MQRIIDEQIDELLRNDCIEPSQSPHSAPIVLVGKKSGEMRLCVDFRQLNAHSIPDAYPLPRITHILERLRHAKYISTLDLNSGYWQISMAHFFKRSLVYLGHVISEEGIHTDPETISAVRQLSPPTTCKALRRCLGIAPRQDTSESGRQPPGSPRDVRKCDTCQQFKVSQTKPADKMFTRQINEAFDTVCSDFIGPLLRSKGGNTMLLVFFDAFSKWVAVY